MRSAFLAAFILFIGVWNVRSYKTFNSTDQEAFIAKDVKKRSYGNFDMKSYLSKRASMKEHFLAALFDRLHRKRHSNSPYVDYFERFAKRPKKVVLYKVPLTPIQLLIERQKMTVKKDKPKEAEMITIRPETFISTEQKADNVRKNHTLFSTTDQSSTTEIFHGFNIDEIDEVPNRKGLKSGINNLLIENLLGDKEASSSAKTPLKESSTRIIMFSSTMPVKGTTEVNEAMSTSNRPTLKNENLEKTINLTGEKKATTNEADKLGKNDREHMTVTNEQFTQDGAERDEAAAYPLRITLIPSSRERIRTILEGDSEEFKNHINLKTIPGAVESFFKQSTEVTTEEPVDTSTGGHSTGGDEKVSTENEQVVSTIVHDEEDNQGRQLHQEDHHETQLKSPSILRQFNEKRRSDIEIFERKPADNLEITPKMLLQIIPVIIYDLRNDSISAEDMKVLSEMYGDYWPNILQLADRDDLDLKQIIDFPKTGLEQLDYLRFGDTRKTRSADYVETLTDYVMEGDMRRNSYDEPADSGPNIADFFDLIQTAKAHEDWKAAKI